MKLQNPMPWTTCGNLTSTGFCSKDEFMSIWILSETFVYNAWLTTSAILVFERHFSFSFEKHCLCLQHHLSITWCSGRNFLISCLQSKTFSVGRVNPGSCGLDTLGILSEKHIFEGQMSLFTITVFKTKDQVALGTRLCLWHYFQSLQAT